MFVFFLCVVLSSARLGIDVSQLTPTSSLSCLRMNGFNGMIMISAWKPVGTFDVGAIETLKNARAAGYPRESVDLVFHPCVACGNLEDQVNTFWKQVDQYKSNFNRVWFSVDGNWTSSVSKNRDYLMQMMKQVRAIGIEHGIFASRNEWTRLFDFYDYPYASSTPLWYTEYDNSKSFSYFVSFGGWTSPAMKQYRGDDFVCATSVNCDYKP